MIMLLHTLILHACIYFSTLNILISHFKDKLLYIEQDTTHSVSDINDQEPSSKFSLQAVSWPEHDYPYIHESNLS